MRDIPVGRTTPGSADGPDFSTRSHGLAYSSLPALIVSAVPASETGAANGHNTLLRSIGTSVPAPSSD
ncbi:hypothetical protein OK006_9460 [Actinobacteria bacterium OK006]|nr:hypothetical protein OK006_9460 [Actinobacteria bacterium OK006]